MAPVDCGRMKTPRCGPPAHPPPCCMISKIVMMMDPINCQSILRDLSFGQRIAEEERDNLARYFVETDQWRRICSDEVDIVYGAKGSGKSALYFLLVDRSSAFAGSGLFLVTAENPRGTPVFRDLVTEPPASEREFVALWKLYLLSLLGREVHGLGSATREASELLERLRDADLLEPAGGLKGLLRNVRDYVRRFSGLEGGLALDPVLGTPSGLTAKILFEQPSAEQRRAGLYSIDELFERANSALAANGTRVWILLDRLDVAFAETDELEQNALRALFRTYLDLQGHGAFRLKIFLRSDIWNRLTESGFREASHLTRSVTISWDRASLLNLIVRRALQCRPLCQLYSVDQQLLSSTADQETLFYWMFPDQVESGSNKPRTLEWLLSHTQDGSKETAPRELIHLLNSIRDTQYRKLELGETPPDNKQLFSRPAIKEAMPEVSKTRLEQTLYAEYPTLRSYCEKMRGDKSAQTLESLDSLWGTDRQQTQKLARKLVEVGFFEERTVKDKLILWVPFLYRDALELIQGTAVD